MMDTDSDAAWEPTAVLANLSMGRTYEDLPFAVEGGYYAIVGHEDLRLLNACDRHPVIRRFLGRFKDAFGDCLSPAVVMRRSDAPAATRTVEASAGFRDAVAMSVIPLSRARGTGRRTTYGVAYSDQFDFYPWMLTRDYHDLVAMTPAMLAIHEVRLFRGQSTPGLAPASLRDSDVDVPLLEELLRRWRRLHGGEAPPSHDDVALFRSLNMAFQASRMPGGQETSIYDIGRLIALWISAFEILVHPGGNGRSGPSQVLDRLRSVQWLDPRIAELLPPTPGMPARRRTQVAEIAPDRLYRLLYDARNDFLHGNPLDELDLVVAPSGIHIARVASALYRLALTATLDLRFDRPSPPLDDVAAWTAWAASRRELHEHQGRFESVVSAVFATPNAEHRENIGRRLPAPPSD
ncbi:MAG: hypothetical protein RLO06_18460 [Parvibaculum sp.]|jgi:hypothetical protein